MKINKSVIKDILFGVIIISLISVISLIISRVFMYKYGDVLFNSGLALIIACYFYSVFVVKNIGVAKDWIISGCLIMLLGNVL